MVLGSADYIAPEQIDDPHAADIRADLYSLGCTLYFLLAGRPPFPDGSLIQKLMAHREKLPRPLADVRAGMPRELVLLVDRMMAKSPPQRFQTPDEVALALAPFADAQAARAAATARADALTLPETAPSLVPKVGGAEGPWQRVTTPGKGRRRTWLHLAVALAFLALGGGSLGLIFTLNRGDKTVRVQALPPDRSTDEEPPIAEVGELPGHDVLKQAKKTIVTERPEALNPVPTPMSNPLNGPEPEEVGTLVRFPEPARPARAGEDDRCSCTAEKMRGGPSLAYAWDGKSEHPSLLFSRKSRVVQELHSFAIGRDGRQYYLSWNEPSVVEADQDGERRVFSHTTYVRDLALDEDDHIYFSEASGAGSRGKIYRLVPATEKAAARAELFCTVDPRKVSGYWDGPFAFGRNAKGKLDTNTLYLSSGNCVPAYVFRMMRIRASGPLRRACTRPEGQSRDLCSPRRRPPITCPTTRCFG